MLVAEMFVSFGNIFCREATSTGYFVRTFLRYDSYSLIDRTSLRTLSLLTRATGFSKIGISFHVLVYVETLGKKWYC